MYMFRVREEKDGPDMECKGSITVYLEKFYITNTDIMTVAVLPPNFRPRLSKAICGSGQALRCYKREQRPRPRCF